MGSQRPLLPPPNLWFSGTPSGWPCRARPCLGAYHLGTTGITDIAALGHCSAEGMQPLEARAHWGHHRTLAVGPRQAVACPSQRAKATARHQWALSSGPWLANLGGLKRLWLRWDGPAGECQFLRWSVPRGLGIQGLNLAAFPTEGSLAMAICLNPCGHGDGWQILTLGSGHFSSLPA